MIQSFVKCFSPLVLRDPRGYPYQVPCGKCIACQNNKRSSLSLKLRLEEYTSKYCYFLTLTYDDDNLPLFSIGRDTCATEFLRIYPYSERLRNDSLISDFCSDFYEFDNDFIDKMDYYSAFVINYERKFNKSCVYGHGLYALLYYRDIQLFLKRLRKHIFKYYGEKIRFYFIGEYGTKSLRPHWHCLLFFNSSSLSQAFEDCVNVGTTSRPCSCPRFLRPLWQFGICDSKRTNGEAYNYVSSYVNQSANFPKLLVLLSNQKAYHSIQLGQILPEESFVSAIQKGDFSFFERQFYIDSFGVANPYSVWRSYYSRFFPKFTCSSQLTFEQTYRVLTCYDTLRDLFDTDSVGVICRRLFYHYHFGYPDYHDIFDYLRFAYYAVLHSKDMSLFSALRSCVLASRTFLRAASKCGLTPVAYFRKYMDFYSYLDLSHLRAHFENCVASSEYCTNYYNIYQLRHISGDYIFGSDSEYSRFRVSEQIRFARSIKHRDHIALLNINSNL